MRWEQLQRGPTPRQWTIERRMQPMILEHCCALYLPARHRRYRDTALDSKHEYIKCCRLMPNEIQDAASCVAAVRPERTPGLPIRDKTLVVTDGGLNGPRS